MTSPPTIAPTGVPSGATAAAVAAAAPEPIAAKVGRYRWTICALLVFATTINYVDRQVTGVLGPTLQAEFGWSERQYADVTSWWTSAYAIGFLLVGRFIDKVGVRIGFAVAVVVWSIAGAAHGLTATIIGFGIARFFLGLGEAGNFPAAIKATAEWFPKQERAFATGIFNAGSNVGAVITALIVPWITLHYGWRWAFIVTGLFGFVWLAFWWPLYSRPSEAKRLSAGERAWIESSDAQEVPTPAKRVGWVQLLQHRQTWTFVVGKFLTDGVWWFYMFWLPKFLDARYGIKLGKLALPLIVIYVVADVGSVGGGWMSGALIKRGWATHTARKVTLLTAALLIVPTATAPLAGSLWVAVAIVSVAAAAHQWWSANLFTLTSDMFPRHAVASVVGLGGFAGAVGGVLFQRATGRILEANGSNYLPIFLICGFAYVTALAIIHLLSPRMETVRLEPRA
jgi:ACS family hexuronate transporter-like MFS transporter